MPVNLLGCHLRSSALNGAAGSVHSLQPWVARCIYQPSLNQNNKQNHYIAVVHEHTNSQTHTYTHTHTHTHTQVVGGSPEHVEAARALLATYAPTITAELRSPIQEIPSLYTTFNRYKNVNFFLKRIKMD